HLILPSPAFAWLATLVDFPQDRILLQYEGTATRWDQNHWRALLDDPILMAPRMILNHWLWSLAGRLTTASHLAIGSHAVANLRSLGYTKVFQATNVTNFSPKDQQKSFTWPDGFDDPHQCRIGYIGHCFPVKGIDDLLPAFAQACGQNPNLRLLLALSGDGHPQRVHRWLHRLRLHHKVALLGLIPVQQWLEQLDALVLPYRSAVTTTLFPSLMLEADRASCPLITTAVPEWEEILLTTAPHLTIVPPRNVSALAQAMAAVRQRHSHHPVSFLNLPSQETRLVHMQTIYRHLAGLEDTVRTDNPCSPTERS
ncbi:MAG: glycosyltransferase, partial [Magnetococcales bacterium]|nr:glycosyltransferase [Magnetococcales bacterium]